MKFSTNLTEYQVKAVDKLIKIKIGALYMEQGTGKTRTALELIAKRLNSGKVEKVLWLCPFSIKTEIKKEIKKHCTSDDNIIIFGIESLSNSIRINQYLYDFVKKYKTYLIIDESNLIKNHKAKRTRMIKRIGQSCDYKLILNGTPISKNESDLFSQWDILDWRILGYRSFYSFSANHLEYDDYGRIRRTLNTDYLTRKIAPYSYQIKKSECLNLKQKIYFEDSFYLTSEQQEHYEYIKDIFLMQVDEFEPHTLYRLFTALQHVLSGNKIISNYNKPIKTVPFFDNVYDNPRIKKLIKIIPEVDKCIIWCKYVHEILEIEQVLKEKYGNDSCVKFYGGVNKKNRQKNIELFKNKCKYLIANKTCAGYGLNLQFCNNAIYYSNDWDYATRIQSEDRIHRMGQEKEVKIYDIYASDTLDYRIICCLYKKENLIKSFKEYLKKYKNNNKKIKSWLSK